MNNNEMTPAYAKIRVYGKAQNRTALGIMHAYMKMYPEATLNDLRQAFPNDLNKDKGVDENFILKDEKNEDSNWNGYFSEEESYLNMGDGKQVAVVSMWTKTSFEKVVKHAEQYGIIVAKFEASEGTGKRGSFKLEYLNGFVPPVVTHQREESTAPVPEQPKKSKWWLWLLLLLLLGALAAYFLGNKEPKVIKEVVTVEKIKTVRDTIAVVDTIAIVDTVYIQQLEEIEKNFNAAQFEKAKSELTEEAKFVLYDLVKMLEKNPDLKIQVVGHTSAEGEVEFNNKLSEARAKSAVDFVISRGISANRLSYEGKGSSELKNKENPLAPENRRTEFIVIE